METAEVKAAKKRSIKKVAPKSELKHHQRKTEEE